MFHRHLLAAVLTVAATGCASSSILIGTARPPIDPALVRLYVDPPERFEKIAILESNSDASWAITDRQKTNKAIDRLKIEAAKYGANGVLIEGVGDQYSGSVSVTDAWSDGYTAYGVSTSTANYRKAGWGMAIYVNDQETAVAAPLSQGASASATSPAAPASPQAGSAYDAALRYAAERDCSAGGVAVVSGNVYRASCPSTGRSLVIQCQGQSCKEVN